MCLGIARVLGAPPEAVFRRAGLLPPVPPAVADEDELVHIFRRLPATLRSAVLLMVRALRPLQLPALPHRAAEARADDDLSGAQLLEAFRHLPPELQRVAPDELESAQRWRIIGLEEDQAAYDQAPREEAAEKADV